MKAPRGGKDETASKVEEEDRKTFKAVFSKLRRRFELSLGESLRGSLSRL